MSEKEVKRWDILINKFNKNQKVTGAEIGVWDGRTSVKLLNNNKNLFLYMIDRWISVDKNDTYFNTFDADIIARSTQIEFDEAYKEAINKIKPYKKRCKIIKKDSINASKEFEDESLDFVFIDADHSYEGVKKDIYAWMPKVKKDGWLCGHDYKNGKLVGVKSAVDEILGEKNIISENDHTWSYRI